MQKEYFFEIFINLGEDEGTQTVETVDTIEEVNKYIADHPDQELFYDEWEMNPDGSDIKPRVKNL